MPRACSAPASPIPARIRIAGDCKAPADTMTSPASSASRDPSARMAITPRASRPDTTSLRTVVSA